MFRTHPSAVCTVLDDGGVLLHLDTKFYYSLNASGLAVWMLLENGVTDPLAAVARRFPDAPDRDAGVTGLLDDLEREQLIERDDALSNGGSGENLDLETWIAPVLTRHAVPLSQILTNPFDPCVPLAE